MSAPCACTPLVNAAGEPYSQPIGTWFGDCVYSTDDYLSFAAGLVTMVLWMFAQFPQLWLNFKRKRVDALSAGLLATWFLGDFTNYLGCILTNQLPTQRYTALYYTCIDIVILFQFCYYRFLYKRWYSASSGTYRGLPVSGLPVSEYSKLSSGPAPSIALCTSALQSNSTNSNNASNISAGGLTGASSSETSPLLGVTMNNSGDASTARAGKTNNNANNNAGWNNMAIAGNAKAHRTARLAGLSIPSLSVAMATTTHSNLSNSTGGDCSCDENSGRLSAFPMMPYGPSSAPPSPSLGPRAALPPATPLDIDGGDDDDDGEDEDEDRGNSSGYGSARGSVPVAAGAGTGAGAGRGPSSRAKTLLSAAALFTLTFSLSSSLYAATTTEPALSHSGASYHTAATTTTSAGASAGASASASASASTAAAAWLEFATESPPPLLLVPSSSRKLLLAATDHPTATASDAVAVTDSTSVADHAYEAAFVSGYAPGSSSVSGSGSSSSSSAEGAVPPVHPPPSSPSSLALSPFIASASPLGPRSCRAEGPAPGSTLARLGPFVAWISGLSYLLSRTPQIAHMLARGRRGARGLAPQMFFTAFTANGLYGLSVLLRKPRIDGEFWRATFPFILGSVGTMVFDFVILCIIFRLRLTAPAKRSALGVNSDGTTDNNSCNNNSVDAECNGSDVESVMSSTAGSPALAAALVPSDSTPASTAANSQTQL